MQNDNQHKEEQLLKKRFIELSRLAYQREFITYSNFLNLNEIHILHSLSKEELYTKYIVFGGYDAAERQMAAFLPDALYLRWKDPEVRNQLPFPFYVLSVTPLHQKYAEVLTHRDYLGAILNLGIERSKIGDIVEKDQIIAMVDATPVYASLTGVLRGIIRDGYEVPKGMKIADIDPRKEQKKNCDTVSDKARCIAGSVVEVLLANGVLP